MLDSEDGSACGLLGADVFEEGRQRRSRTNQQGDTFVSLIGADPIG